MGSTLASGEDGGVDSSLNVGLLVLPEEDETSSGTSQGLVGGGGDDITVLEWRALFTSGNKTGNVSHVGKKVSSLSIGNLPQSRVIPISGVGGSTTNEQSGLVEVGVGLELGVVDDTGGGVDSVWERLEVDGRSGNLLLGSVVTVSQVASVRETETHDSVLGVDERSEGGEAGISIGYLDFGSLDSLGGRSRVWLNVDSPDLGVEVECLQGSLSTKVLEDIDVLHVSICSTHSHVKTHLVTTVVSSSGETLRVLVGQHGSVGLHDSERGQVLKSQSARSHPKDRQSTYLGSDKLQTRELPPCLLLDKRVDLGIGILQRSVEVLIL